MKIRVLFCLISLNAWAGVLSTRCLDIDKNGQLIKDNKSIGCEESAPSAPYISEYDSTHAKGMTRTQPFEISITQKNNNEVMVYEISTDQIGWDLSANLAANSTNIKNGKINDQTICSRYISKTNPITATDSLTCVTINQTLCTNFFKTLKPDFKNEGISKKLDDIKKCQNIIDNQMSSLYFAMSSTFSDPEYKALSKARYDDLRKGTSKSVNSSLISSVKWSYNDSDAAVDSMNLKFRDVSYGYSWMKTTFDKCLNYFPPKEYSTSNPKELSDAVSK